MQHYVYLMRFMFDGVEAILFFCFSGILGIGFTFFNHLDFLRFGEPYIISSVNIGSCGVVTVCL